MNVPHILKNGAAWYRQWGTEKSAGTKVLSVSGPVKRPGNYEIPLGLPLRTLIESPSTAAACATGFKLKAVIPGGSSVPLLPASLLDTGARLRVHERGRHVPRLGRRDRDRRPDLHRGRAVEHHRASTSTSRAASARRAARARTGWSRSSSGSRTARARARDIDLLGDLADNILGKSFCALGDAAAMPVQGMLKHFRAEFEYHVTAQALPGEPPPAVRSLEVAA